MNHPQHIKNESSIVAFFKDKYFHNLCDYKWSQTYLSPKHKLPVNGMPTALAVQVIFSKGLDPNTKS